METTEAVFKTVLLIAGAGITAGLWLNILMWIPMLVIGWALGDEGFGLVSLLAMLVAAAAVIVFGLAVLELPVAAAVIAGLVIGLTSYASPNAAPAYDF